MFQSARASHAKKRLTEKNMISLSFFSRNNINIFVKRNQNLKIAAHIALHVHIIVAIYMYIHVYTYYTKKWGRGAPRLCISGKSPQSKKQTENVCLLFNIFLMLSYFIYISQTTKLSEKNQTFKHAEPRGTVCGSNFSIRCSWSGVFYMLFFMSSGHEHFKLL